MIRISTLAATILALLAPLTAAALTPQQVETDIALAQEAFERLHPGYDRYADPADLGDAWQSIVSEAQSRGEMSLADLYLRVQAVLAMIRCDHTKAELPPDMAKARRTEPVYLPLRFTLAAEGDETLLIWLDPLLLDTLFAIPGLRAQAEIWSADMRWLATQVDARP